HEATRAFRREIAVATPQPGVPVTLDVREEPLHRLGGGGHQLEAPRVRSLPEAREVDESNYSAGHRVVHRSPGADPFVVALIEMLEGEDLKSMICRECSPDTVGAVGRFHIPCALEQIHL